MSQVKKPVIRKELPRPISRDSQSSQNSSVQSSSRKTDQPEKEQRQPNYSGTLASEKFFTSQQLNSLAQVNKAAGQKRKEENKIQPIKPIHDLNDSVAILDQTQQEKLKLLNAAPFRIGSQHGSRPSTGQKALQQIGKENSQEADDDLEDKAFEEEITKRREKNKQLLERLNQTDREQEISDLQSCFDDLRSQLGNDIEKEIDERSIISEKELKDSRSNFYKPNLRGGSKLDIKTPQPNKPESKLPATIINTPVQKQVVQKQEVDETKQVQNSNLTMQNLNQFNQQSNMNAIDDKIKAFQQMLLDVKGDLNDYMDDIESVVNLPQEFNDVVDIAVDYQKDKTELMSMAEGTQDEETKSQLLNDLEGNERPMWMQFFKADYLASEENKEDPEVIRKRKAMDEIRKNDMYLQQHANQERILREARRKKLIGSPETKVVAKQTRPPSGKPSARKEEEKKMIKPNMQPKRGGSKTSERSSKKSMGNKEDVFLTNFEGRSAKKRLNRKAEDDEDTEIDPEELQDEVYDYEYNQRLMIEADEYLNEPLALPAPGDDKSSPSKQINQSRASFNSNMTQTTDKIAANKQAAKDFSFYKRKKYFDQLSEEEKLRYEQLQENLDEAIELRFKSKSKQPEEQKQPTKQRQNSKNREPSKSAKDIEEKMILENIDSHLQLEVCAYNYNEDQSNRIDEINRSLAQITPMLPPSETDSMHNQSRMAPSKFNNSDVYSEMSVPISIASRISNMSKFTLGTQMPKQLPGESVLKSKAENRAEQNMLRDIDKHLNKINKTDDLSYMEETKESESNPNQGYISELGQELVLHRRLIDQDTLQALIEDCREEEERRSIMSEMDMSKNTGHKYGKDPELALAMIETQTQNRALMEAEQIFNEVTQLYQKYNFESDQQEEGLKAIFEAAPDLIQLLQREKLENEKRKETYSTKLATFQTEIDSYVKSLESKEAFFAELQSKEEELNKKFNTDYTKTNAHIVEIDIVDEDIHVDEEDEKWLAIEQSVREYHKVEESVQEFDFEIEALTKKLAKELDEDEPDAGEESKQSDY